MPKVRPLLIRIEENIFYSPDGCWYWTGKCTPRGYGVIEIDKRAKLVHRVMYRQYISDPGDLSVCHKCDNPCCVNPNHLFLGTHTDNMQDMVKKGRRRPTTGEDNPKSKLTICDVMKIRSYRGVPHSDIAYAFGVSRSTISSILTYRTWK